MGKKKEKVSKRLLKKQKETGNPAVIFSFDGTVMDTEPAIFASYRHLFSKFGKGRRFGPKEEEMVMGQSSVRMVKEFFPKDDDEEILKEYRLYQSYHLADLIQPMAGIKDFVKYLKEKGYPTAIISSRSRSSIMTMLEHTGLAPYFDVIIASSSKDHEFTGPEALLRAAKLLKRKCCIYIGHTPTHIQNGRSLGLFTIAYDSNPKQLYEIIDAGPDFVTADYRQVRKLLEGDPLWLAYEIIEPQEEEASQGA
ncbi:MAG: HAD hydrolase-like protein [Solobacterium sp.]|nr:HAD hydrolase-like protein [Solobacterium sp.]